MEVRAVPCDRIVLQKVELGVNLHPDLLREAMEEIGADRISASGFRLNQWAYGIQGGLLVSQDPNVGRVADELKRAYGGAVVRYVARRQGWQVKRVGQYRYQVVKR